MGKLCLSSTLLKKTAAAPWPSDHAKHVAKAFADKSTDELFSLVHRFKVEKHQNPKAGAPWIWTIMPVESMEAAELLTLIRIFATKKFDEISLRKSNFSDGKLVRWLVDAKKKANRWP